MMIISNSSLTGAVVICRGNGCECGVASVDKTSTFLDFYDIPRIEVDKK